MYLNRHTCLVNSETIATLVLGLTFWTVTLSLWSQVAVSGMAMHVE